MITIIFGRILNLKRNWMPYAFLMLLPLILLFIFGAMVSGEGGVFLPVADLDETEYSKALVKELKGSGAYSIRLTDEEDLKRMVTENEAEAGLIIPRGFGEGIVREGEPEFDIFITRESPSGYSLQGTLTAASQRIAYNGAIADGTAEILKRHMVVDEDNGAVLKDRIRQLSAEGWSERLPIKVISTTEGGGGQNSFDMYTQVSIGFTIAFSMFVMVFAVGEILEEKRTGVWDRIQVSPVSRFQVLTGGLIQAFVMGIAYTSVMALIGDSVLGVDWLGNAFGVFVILSAFCFCMVSFGLCISSGIKTSQQLQVIAPVVLVSSGMLGGCYWPLEIVNSKALLIASKAIPAGWAMEALKSMIIYHRGINAIYLPAAVLLLMGSIFLGIAVQLGE